MRILVVFAFRAAPDLIYPSRHRPLKTLPSSLLPFEISHLFVFFCMLVMAPKKNAAAYLRMVYTTNSLRDTTLSVEDDALYYEVVTRFWLSHLTREMVLVTSGCVSAVRTPNGSTNWFS